jgi:hypothetical protein
VCGPRATSGPDAREQMSEIEVSRRLRIVVANRLIAVGWALKGSCKPCARWLFTNARWLVPEAQRFLVQRTGLHTRNRRLFEGLVGRIQPRVVGGFLIVLTFVGLLDLAMRNTETNTQPLTENSAFLDEAQTPPKRKILSVSKSSEPMEVFVSETSSISEATQIAPVPLPLRKPERVYKGPKAAKANPATQKRMAQQKKALQKPIR